MQLNAQQSSLITLLGVFGLQFVVPPYQRPYAWRREQVDDLWDDLKNAVGQRYFMGSLVLNNENSQRPEVIDGQQRLTTLLLLVSLLRDRYVHAGVYDKAAVLQNFFLLADPFAEGDLRYRLRTGDANWPVFRDYALRSHDDPDRKAWSAAASEPKAVRARNSALFTNAKLLEEKLDVWLDGYEATAVRDRLQPLEATIVQGIEFVVIKTGSAADAFLLFETLNDRGLRLSQGDLLKNHLLAQLAAAGVDSPGIEEAASEWDALLDDLGPNVDVTRFLRHYLLAKMHPVRQEEVFNKFKAEVRATGPRALLKDLRAVGLLYGEFANPKRCENSAVAARLDALLTLRAENCYPALLMARKHLAEKDFVEFARLAEILTYRYSSVCSLDSKALTAVYHRAARLLASSKGSVLDEARAELLKEMPSSPQFKASFQRQRMGAHYLLRYTLQNIEHFLNPGKEFKDNLAVHIEHVLPQILSEKWECCLGSNAADHEAYVHRWGNLTLLHAPLNQEASNSLFASKQEIYRSSRVLLTTSLCDYLRWGFDTIERRQAWLADVADLAWPATGIQESAKAAPRAPDGETLLGEHLSEEDRTALLCARPKTPRAVADLKKTIDEHVSGLGDRMSAAAGLKADLAEVIDRWDELGAEGRRIVDAAVAYFCLTDDLVPDTEEAGLADDHRIILGVCRALDVERLNDDL